ncbi:histidine kinase [Paenibacillus sp. UMB7766-LJ446]|uniref:sensor histidine kinase n=1 Tax=Paenibacillus sp. UMB7766-LJ446 TaxID=3046313 RepID=UPI002551AC8F|nr:histidine kinase [Paenibacillus sp. UMB7766-LJ446]MDK8189915.1 histidine kinase [Paenibacillus sp. UMB7766-LJ446]
MRRKPIFYKLALLIVVLLLPLAALNTYTNEVSDKVIRQQIEDSTSSRLSLFTKQLDSNIEQLNMISGYILRDPTVKEMSVISFDSEIFDRVKTIATVQEKMGLLSYSNKWKNEISLYFPPQKLVITPGNVRALLPDELKTAVDRNWTYRPHMKTNVNEGGFYRSLSQLISSNRSLDNSSYVVEVGFSENNIKTMLDQFKSNNKGDPFLFNPQSQLQITNRSAEISQIKSLSSTLSEHSELSLLLNNEMKINGSNYFVSSTPLSLQGWYLIDYIPLKEALSSVAFNRNLFYMCIALIVLLGLVGVVFLYRSVQVPITRLVKGLRRVQIGDYTVRFPSLGRSEFDFVYQRFNDMATEIQDLVDKVLSEQIHSKEATLRQLQSQINPHFLYNCLYFIKNMASMGREDLIEQMTVSLAEFFRYTTRTEKRLANVAEETEFIEHYLKIQQLRMPRLSFDISIDPTMLDIPLPRLTLQPLVENAIVHGIEQNIGYGIIKITGTSVKGLNTIHVDDNGEALGETIIKRLNDQLQKPLDDKTGVGIWNVHQRIVLEFGEETGLSFHASPLGGLRSTIQWVIKDKKENAI